MRKLSFYLLASLTCAALIFTSCKDDKDDNTSGAKPLSPSEVEKYPYSSLTPEQQKEKLAGEANAFLSQVQDMNQEKSLEVFKAFGDLLMADAPVIGGKALRSSENIIKINQFYGKFTWQDSTQRWKEEPAEQLEFHFPVKNSQGKIVVTGESSGKYYTFEEYYDEYDEVEVWDSWCECYTTRYQWVGERTETTSVELPKELSAKLSLGGSEVGSIQVNADIVQKETAPRSVSVSFNFGPYKFEQSYSKSTGKAVASLKKGSEVLIDISAVLKGNIDNLIDDNNTDKLAGNFSLFIMDNFAITGNIDFDKYITEDNALFERCYPDDYDWETFDWDKADENYAKGSVDIFNKYCDLYLVSTTDKTKIAKLTQKAKLKTSQWEYCEDGEYDWDTDTWYCKKYSTRTETYWTAVPMFRFNDSTEVEAEVYFSKGFDAVIKNFETFVQSFE